MKKGTFFSLLIISSVLLILSFVYSNVYFAVAGFILCMILKKYSNSIAMPKKFAVAKKRLDEYKDSMNSK